MYTVTKVFNINPNREKEVCKTISESMDEGQGYFGVNQSSQYSFMPSYMMPHNISSLIPSVIKYIHDLMMVENVDFSIFSIEDIHNYSSTCFLFLAIVYDFFQN